jgi:outer membrane lipopolysaccharide assembly protein LptE/RlpB
VVVSTALAQGQTKKQIRHYLKRYLARQIYRTLTAVSRVDEARAAVTGPTPQPA